MPNYKFHWFSGQSRPEKTIWAKDDNDARQQITAFLEENSGTLDRGTIKATETKTWDVDDPPGRMPIGEAITRLLEGQDKRGVAPLSQQ